MESPARSTTHLLCDTTGKELTSCASSLTPIYWRLRPLLVPIGSCITPRASSIPPEPNPSGGHSLLSFASTSFYSWPCQHHFPPMGSRCTAMDLQKATEDLAGGAAGATAARAVPASRSSKSPLSPSLPSMEDRKLPGCYCCWGRTCQLPSQQPWPVHHPALAASRVAPCLPAATIPSGLWGLDSPCNSSAARFLHAGLETNSGSVLKGSRAPAKFMKQTRNWNGSSTGLKVSWRKGYS